ncbi:MAG TPA: outer membrane protein assembly factor BamE [Candidatus Thioglobus sp.]|nr:outer membrane protein assembly factor BamE [Candidatus Thioglobus sp.]
MNKLTLIVFSFSFSFLSACSPSMPSMPQLPDMPDIIPDMSLPTLYKDDINQGSVLDRFKINQLKLGMSQAQVQDLIGSPSIIDPFHNKQWNYINHSTLHEKDDVHYRLILTFDDKKLTEIDTSGISSLSALTEKEKELEGKRIAEEKAAVVAKQAAIQAKKIAAEKLAAEKERAAEQARVANEQRIANEKLATEKAQAEALKKKNELAQIKQRKADQQKAIKAAEEKIIIQQPKPTTNNKSPVPSQEEVSTDKPWYQFW